MLARPGSGASHAAHRLVLISTDIHSSGMTTSALATLRSRIRHTPLFPLIRRRRFHAYSLGGPKTGTTSIALLFEKRFRAAHEPLHAGTMEHVLGALTGAKGRDELVRYLRWRDRELYLEMESSHPTAVFVELLVELFPQSKFILTVREPRSWLDSIINQQLNGRRQRARMTSPGPRAAFFPALHEIVCRAGHFPFASGESVLEEHGLYPLDGYLSWWAEHNRRVLEAVPRERLLVLRTESLSSEVDRIADFLGVPAAELNLSRQHSNQAAQRFGLVDRIDAELLAQKVEYHCASVYELMDAVPRARARDLAVG